MTQKLSTYFLKINLTSAFAFRFVQTISNPLLTAFGSHYKGLLISIKTLLIICLVRKGVHIN